MNIKVKSVESTHPGLNFAGFIMELSKPVDLPLRTEVNGYPIYIHHREKRRRDRDKFLYYARYVINDADRFIPPEDIIGKELKHTS